MKFASVLILQLVLVVAGLLVYDAVRDEPPAPEPSRIPTIQPVELAPLPKTPAPSLEGRADDSVGPRLAEIERNLARLDQQAASEAASRRELEARIEALALAHAAGVPAAPRVATAPGGSDTPAVDEVARFRLAEARARWQAEADRRASHFRARLKEKQVRLSPEQETAVVEEMLQYQTRLPQVQANMPSEDPVRDEAVRKEAKEAYEQALGRVAPRSEVARILEATEISPLPPMR